MSALRPVQAAGMLAEVERTGPFAGGGYKWSIALKPKEPTGRDEFAPRVSNFPKIGVQQANVTGTGARVRIDKRNAHEVAAAQQVVSLGAPLPLTTAEQQMIICYLADITPSEAVNRGGSFALTFRGETTEVSGLCMISVR